MVKKLLYIFSILLLMNNFSFAQCSTMSEANITQDQVDVCGNTYKLIASPIKADETGTWTLTDLFQEGAPASVDANGVVTGIDEDDILNVTYTVSKSGCTDKKDDATIFGKASMTVASIAAETIDVCSGTDVDLVANSVASGETGTWSGGLTPMNANNSTTTAGTSTGGDFTMFWTISSSGCDDSKDSIIVHVDDVPTTAVAGTDINTCANTAQLAGNDPVIGTGVWSLVSGTGVAFTDATVYNTSLNNIVDYGSYTLRWTTSNGVCSSTSDEVIVKNVGKVTTPKIYLGGIEVGASADLCIDDDIQISGSNPLVNTGGVQEIFTWSKDAGTSVDVPTSNTGEALTLNSAGSTKIRYTVSTTVAGCNPEFKEVTFNVYAKPVATINPVANTEVCEGTTVSLSAVDPSGTNSTGVWAINTGSVPTATGANGENISFASPTLLVGDHIITWTVENAGCTAVSASQGIRVERQIKPEINLNLVGTSPKCLGTSIDVQATVTGTNGLVNGLHQWQRDDVDTTINSANSISVPADKLGATKITYKMDYSSYSCIDPSTVTEQFVTFEVIEGPRPMIKLSNPNDTVACNKSVSVQLTTPIGMTNGASHTIQWFVNNVSVSPDKIDSLVVTKQSNVENYMIRVEENNGICVQSTTSNDVVIKIQDASQCINSVFNTQSTKKLSFYPNPATGNELVVEGDNLASIIISNQLGQTMLSQTIENNKVDISTLDKGLYILYVSTKDGDVYSETLIKE